MLFVDSCLKHEPWLLHSSLATSAEKPLQQIHCLTPSFRLLQVQSHWLQNGLA